MRTAEEIIEEHFKGEYYTIQNIPNRILRTRKRDMYVMKRRLKNQTLQQVADDLFITRERVRQVQNKVIDRVVASLPTEEQKAVEKLLNGTFKNTHKKRKSLWKQNNNI